MIYRFATIADAPILATMNQQLIVDERHSNPMTLVELTERMTSFLLGEYHAVLFIPEPSSQESAGYALYRHADDNIYLRQFFVARPLRRAGIGRSAIAWLRANPWKNAPKITLEVLSHNAAALAFYRSLGFADYSVALALAQIPK